MALCITDDPFIINSLLSSVCVRTRNIFSDIVEHIETNAMVAAAAALYALFSLSSFHEHLSAVYIHHTMKMGVAKQRVITSATGFVGTCFRPIGNVAFCRFNCETYVHIACVCDTVPPIRFICFFLGALTSHDATTTIIIIITSLLGVTASCVCV